MRRKQLPDDRLRWDDPNLPVIGKSGREIDYKKMEIKANMALASSIEPSWRNDPTYDLKRKDKTCGD